MAVFERPRNKFDATTDPTVNDDSDEGYEPGSRWINVSGDTAWECVDGTPGAAIWTQGGGSGHLHLGVYVDTEDGNAQMVYCETAPGEIELVEVDS